MEKLQAAAYDSYQPGFAELIPALVQAYDRLPKHDVQSGASGSNLHPPQLELSLGLGFCRRIPGNDVG